MNLSRLDNLGEALRDSTFAHQSRVALIEANRDREQQRWTYREIREEGSNVEPPCNPWVSRKMEWLPS